MKGIILAGGYGTRLRPLTSLVSKQLLPVYDKPMIYYPLSILMLAGIREVLLISTPEDLPGFRRLFGDGSQLGMTIEYVEQEKPNGIAEAFILAESFINGEPVCLALGDNIFYGHGLTDILQDSVCLKEGAVVYAYSVHDPSRYGVVEFDDNKDVIAIKEKPLHPKSNWAVIGIYFYDGKVCEYARTLSPSDRGELEISDLNNIYLKQKQLKVELMGRGYAWFDTGTPKSLIGASNFIKSVEERHGLKIACIEEISFNNGWINRSRLKDLIEPVRHTEYGAYLYELINNNNNDKSHHE